MDPVSKAQQQAKRIVGRPWPKGVSGNPNGRPPGKKPLTELYEEIFADPTYREAVKQQIINTLTTPKVSMAAVLERDKAADRMEGKVVQQVSMEVSGKITLEQVLEAKKKAGK